MVCVVFVYFLYLPYSCCAHDKSRTQKRNKSYNTAASIDSREGRHGTAAPQLFPVFIPAAVMSDKRQRARVQGSWARQVPRPRGGGLAGKYSVTSNQSFFLRSPRLDVLTITCSLSGSTASNHQQVQSNVASMSAVWKSGHQRTPETFEFQPPEKVSSHPEIKSFDTDWPTNHE